MDFSTITEHTIYELCLKCVKNGEYNTRPILRRIYVSIKSMFVTGGKNLVLETGINRVNCYTDYGFLFSDKLFHK